LKGRVGRVGEDARRAAAEQRVAARAVAGEPRPAARRGGATGERRIAADVPDDGAAAAARDG